MIIDTESTDCNKILGNGIRLNSRTVELEDSDKCVETCFKVNA